MKNYSLKSLIKLSFVFLFCTGVSAQTMLHDNTPKGISLNDPLMDKNAQRLNKKAEFSGWMDPITAVINSGGNFGRFVSFLTPDSNAVWVNSDNSKVHWSWHVTGAVFDPTDANLKNADPFINLSPFNNYSVDSIYMPYLYVRYKDSSMVGGNMVETVDTLIFQFFQRNSLRIAALSGNQYGVPTNFTPGLQRANNAAYTLKIPLTSMDSTTPPSSTGWRTSPSFLKVPTTPGTIAADNGTKTNICGFTVSFKAMTPIPHGDTIEVRNGANITNRHNYWGHLMYNNDGSPVIQDKAINNSVWTPKGVRYGQTQNGWTNYIPGNAYFTNRYLVYQIKVSTKNLSVNDLKDGYGLGKAYPNPVMQGADLNIEFALGKSENVSIEIYDLLGHKVKTVANDRFNTGNNTVSFNTSGLSSGVYIYTMKAGSFTASHKFSVSK